MTEGNLLAAGALLSSALALASVIMSFVRKDIYRVNFISGKLATAVIDLYIMFAVVTGRTSAGRGFVMLAAVNLLILINSASLAKSGMNNVITPSDIDDRMKGE